MDYPLENLGPERFQLMCQSLLSREFPRVQCFPIAQPDGGRDAVSRPLLEEPEKFVVYQVKFVRQPTAETDTFRWLSAIVAEEAEKVHRLAALGAREYVLMTNLPGTAHLTVGTIDKLNKIMVETLEIPSTCWWRNDINRRLDNAWSLKWVYPELLSGPDLLRALVESGLSEHRERRTSAVRAFVRYQYGKDEDVRFKQIELQNKLLDLFVDVPISMRQNSGVGDYYDVYRQVSASIVRDEPDDSEIEDSLYADEERPDQEVHAADFLLHPNCQSNFSRIVLEGAPGQGKSTITQYVCQVHRMKLLMEDDALTSVTLDHRNAPARLPIKVDLRDFATWLGKKNPFSIGNDDKAPPRWHKSLEAFLASLISHQSGGTQFTTDDLLAVSKISSLLLVFDGLDEVADISRRREIVVEILDGVHRLDANAAALQVIVTSRPAAFANSPGMPPDKYPHFQLLSLTRPLIMKYAERWLRARRLDAKQDAEFHKVLREKMDQPHLRDLARNPMQLAILLSLILTRGSSLPDKRTALYDDYIDLFLSREAEKSAVVRDHRDILIDIHRYLGWLLHSDAEKGDARARISQEKLQTLVTEYLRREGHNPDIAKELFTGMVERVVAIVSRTEGTFEFEVQPLREYFAACHLYYTAPQSSTV